jgi:hypothetical protein
VKRETLARVGEKGASARCGGTKTSNVRRMPCPIVAWSLLARLTFPRDVDSAKESRNLHTFYLGHNLSMRFCKFYPRMFPKRNLRCRMLGPGIRRRPDTRVGDMPNFTLQFGRTRPARSMSCTSSCIMVHAWTWIWMSRELGYRHTSGTNIRTPQIATAPRTTHIERCVC